MVSAITAIIGILTHANVEMRCGVLNYVFNTPELASLASFQGDWRRATETTARI